MPSKPYTTGSNNFEPDAFFTKWAQEPTLPVGDDLLSALIKAFGLPPSDEFRYHAGASFTLAEMQDVIARGGDGLLHLWYPDGSGGHVRSYLPALMLTSLHLLQRFVWEAM